MYVIHTYALTRYALRRSRI